MRRTLPWLLVLIIAVVGCGQSESPGEEPERATPAEVPSEAEIVAGEPAILERPFTADEIRAEWVPGLRILMRRSYPERSVVERWTVVAADEEGVDIEYATVSDQLEIEGEPNTKRSTWVELRDHASFPAATASREWINRTTLLGELDGWLYRVADDNKATVEEYFFAASLPGVPVQMKIFDGEGVVFELEQTARLRPTTPTQ